MRDYQKRAEKVKPRVREEGEVLQKKEFSNGYKKKIRCCEKKAERRKFKGENIIL